MIKQIQSAALRKATVLISGGIDSAACAHLLAAQGHLVHGIFVDFGQAARDHESRAVERVAFSAIDRRNSQAYQSKL